MSYSFIDHIHNYSVWTAARASQRGFTTTKNIKLAIEKTGLKELISPKVQLTPMQFDRFHRKTANIIIDHLKEKGVTTTYGRAAKIIAIYLKTAIVIRDSGESPLAKIIHPPIDSILLTNLHRKYDELGLSGIRWTKLTEEKYFDLIEKLRTLNFNYFWKLEQYWTPT